jgi:predicted cupin superfamily sugar epimerase
MFSGQSSYRNDFNRPESNKSDNRPGKTYPPRKREPEIDVTGKVESLARTQAGSRQVQNAIAQGTNKVREQIFSEIQPCLVSLMSDIFGNYVIQILVENATDEQLGLIASSLQGQIQILAEDKKSNYVLQKIIENVSKVSAKIDQNETKDRLISFMMETVEACSHHIRELSCHQCGNRIIQAILKFFPDTVKEKLCHKLIQLFDELVNDAYGTYVLQEAAKSTYFQQQVANYLEDNLMNLLRGEQYGLLFLDQYLSLADSKKLESLLTKTFQNHDLLLAFLNANKTIPNSSLTGYLILKKMIESSDSVHLHEFKRILNDFRESFSASTPNSADFLQKLQKQVEKLSLQLAYKPPVHLAPVHNAPKEISPLAKQIIAKLHLVPHPERGHFRETWRGPPLNPGGRSTGTAIYFMLVQGEISHWHKVDAVEIHFWHAGAPAKVCMIHTTGEYEEIILGNDILKGHQCQAIIPKDSWQSCEPLGEYSLISCTVTPGFQFEGFTLAPPDFDPQKLIHQHH